MSLDVRLQNIEKVGKKFAVTNRPRDVVSRIHVYVHLGLKLRLLSQVSAQKLLRLLS